MYSNIFIPFDDSDSEAIKLLWVLAYANAPMLVEEAISAIGTDKDLNVLGSFMLSKLNNVLYRFVGDEVSYEIKSNSLNTMLENMGYNESELSSYSVRLLLKTKVLNVEEIAKEVIQNVIKLYCKGISLAGLSGVTQNGLILEAMPYQAISSYTEHCHLPSKQTQI